MHYAYWCGVISYWWSLKENASIEPVPEPVPEDLSDELDEQDVLRPGLEEADRLIIDDESDDEIIILEPMDDEVSSQSTHTITEQMAATTIAVAPRKVLSQPKITGFLKK